MRLFIKAWCAYIPRFRKSINNLLIPVLGPDEDLITMGYEVCRILRRNGYANSIKALVYLSSDKEVTNVKSALLSELLRFNGVKNYDVSNFYHLVSIVEDIIGYGDVLVISADSSTAASATSILLSSSGGPVEVLAYDLIANTVPLMPGKNARNDFHAELYMNKLLMSLRELLTKAGVSPKDIKYVATNIKDLKYCSKVLKSVGISENALEPTKYVGKVAYFGLTHTLLTLIKSLELASVGDNILVMDLDENFSYKVSLILRVNEDLNNLRGCVSFIDKLLSNDSVVILH
jgi:hypothetical protein